MKKRMKKSIWIVLLVTLCAAMLWGCKEQTPVDEPMIEITPAPSASPLNAQAAAIDPTPALSALSSREISAAEEMVSLTGPFDPSKTTKDDMLLSLRLYASRSGENGISEEYDLSRDPNYLWQEEDFGRLCMRADTAAAFIYDLYGMELPYSEAEYYDAERAEWSCMDGVYRLYPCDAGWKIRQDSYTIDKQSGVYTMRLIKYDPADPEAKDEKIVARFKRADSRYKLRLLSAEFEESQRLNELLKLQEPLKGGDSAAKNEIRTPSPSPAQEKESKKTPTPEKTPTATAEESALPTPTGAQKTEQKATGSSLKGKKIGLDPGHQSKADRDTEPAAPNSDVLKHKVSSGTSGINTGTKEYQVNLDVALLLRDMLLSEGAEVFMTRSTNDVNMSNIARAEFFNEHEVDLGLRLHCNGSTNTEKRGAFMLVPKDQAYPYYAQNVKAAKAILECYGDATGIPVSQGVTYRDDQTGFNWCKRPVTNIEMGHLTNAEDEKLLIDPEFQKKMAQGIFNGIVRYISS